jgi:hypothetical protein
MRLHFETIANSQKTRSIVNRQDCIPSSPPPTIGAGPQNSLASAAGGTPSDAIKRITRLLAVNSAFGFAMPNGLIVASVGAMS